MFNIYYKTYVTQLFPFMHIRFIVHAYIQIMDLKSFGIFSLTIWQILYTFKCINYTNFIARPKIHLLYGLVSLTGSTEAEVHASIQHGAKRQTMESTARVSEQDIRLFLVWERIITLRFLDSCLSRKHMWLNEKWAKFKRHVSQSLMLQKKVS